MNPEEIKLLISHSSEPLVFKNILKWDMLSWSLLDWQNLMKKEKMEFRSGMYKSTKEPQWERSTKLFVNTFQYFLDQTQSRNDNSWLYFDYKYLKTCLKDIKELRDVFTPHVFFIIVSCNFVQDITWAPLGFPEIKTDDCTIWIGSKGAHTPCHIDTYGFNLIHQIYGRKLWVLIPPEENLKPTRIPYEESSIYSQLNFFSPLVGEFQGINNCRTIILEPGDVLYLPHHWWHYVENLETAISINVWIPLPEDDEERLKEALVQFFVKQICDVSNDETNKNILNPNMEEILTSQSSAICEILNRSKKICKEKLQKNAKKTKKEKLDVSPNTEFQPNEIIEKHNCISKIPKLSNKEFLQFLERQNDRFGKSNSPHISENESNIGEFSGKQSKNVIERDDIIELLKVLTDSDVISLIKEKMLNSL